MNEDERRDDDYARVNPAFARLFAEASKNPALSPGTRIRVAQGDVMALLHYAEKMRKRDKQTSDDAGFKGGVFHVPHPGKYEERTNQFRVYRGCAFLSGEFIVRIQQLWKVQDGGGLVVTNAAIKSGWLDKNPDTRLLPDGGWDADNRLYCKVNDEWRDLPEV
jgi:hypothetical protein